MSRTPLPNKAPSTFLVFRLGGDDYGVPLAQVREIVAFVEPRWLPGFASAVLGVIDLRGDALAVFDLGAALGLEKGPRSPEACLVVIDLGGDGASAGLLVDEVRDLVELRDEEVVAVPATYERGLGAHLAGVASRAGQVVRVLDLARLWSANESLRSPASPAASEPRPRVAPPDFQEAAPATGVLSFRRLGGAERAARPAGSPHLTLRTGGRLYALGAGAVGHIVELGILTPLVGAPAEARGSQLVGGVPVIVVDLARLFGETETALGGESRLLLAGAEREVESNTFGWLVEAVEEVIDIELSEALAPPRHGGLRAVGWIAGLARTDQGLVPILEPAALIAAARSIERAGPTPRFIGRAGPSPRSTTASIATGEATEMELQ